MNFLIIEDDERIASFLDRGLRAEGHKVELAADGTTGHAKASAGTYDVIILDLMLPGMHGLALCQSLRAQGLRTPVLMLTALDGTEQIVTGLRMGADDYLTKPFAFDELMARLEALARRGTGAPASADRMLRVADLVFDRDALIVQRAGQTIELTSLEYALLEFLMVEQGKLVSRSRILQNVWGTSTDPLTNIVDVYVRRLRVKLDDGFEPQLIRTIRGRGYRLGLPNGQP